MDGSGRGGGRPERSITLGRPGGVAPPNISHRAHRHPRGGRGKKAADVEAVFRLIAAADLYLP